MNPIVWRLGWALLHFVWQGAAIAVIVAGLMWLLRRRSSDARYGAACGGMLAMVVTTVGTFCLLTPPRPVLIADQIPSPPVMPPPIASDTSFPAGNQTSGPVASAIGSAEPAVLSSEKVVAPEPRGPVTPAAAPPRVRPAPWPQQFSAACERYLPWVVAGWFVGMMALFLRLLAGWIQVQRIRHRLVQPVTDALQTLLADLSCRLDLHRRVRLLLSPVAQVPMTIGWIRPVILLPVSALTGLTPEQLRAILAHELAHIRRCDYLVNIFQSVVETLLFYHPAVWWVSHRIRAEREHCCDDVAVSVCGGSLLYARALAEMERLRAFTPRYAAAATSGSLVRRIHRLVGMPTPRQARSTPWLAGAVGLLIVAGCVAGYRAVQRVEAAQSPPASNALASEVHGRVVDHTGKPVEGVRVYLIDPRVMDGANSQAPAINSSETRSDTEGRFTLKGAGPQTTGVGLIAPDYATVMPLPRHGDPLDVRLPGPATLTIHFDIPGAEPEARFELWNASGIRRQPADSSTGGRLAYDHGSLTVKVPNGGHTTIADLAPGTYSLTRMKTFLRGGDGGVGLSCEQWRLAIGFDQALSVEAVRQEGQYLKGELQGVPMDSMALAYVMVRPARAENDRIPELFTLEAVAADAEGQWKTPLIPPGEYVLTARAYRPLDMDQRDVLYRYSGVRGPDYEGTARVTVVKDATPPNVRIRMQPAAHGNPVELEQRLARLNKERESLDAIREQLKRTKTSTAPSPDVAAQLDDLIGDRLLKMKAEHLSLSAQFAPDHPSITTIEEDVAQLEQKLKDVFHLNPDELNGYLLGQAEKAHRNAIKAEASLRVWLREAESLAEEQKQSRTRAVPPAAIASQPSTVIDVHEGKVRIHSGENIIEAERIEFSAPASRGADDTTATPPAESGTESDLQAYRALEEDLSRAQAERDDLKRKWAQLKAEPSKIVSSSETRALIADGVLEADEIRFKSGWPGVVRDDRIASEAQRQHDLVVLNALATEYASLEVEVAKLRAAYENLKTRQSEEITISPQSRELIQQDAEVMALRSRKLELERELAVQTSPWGENHPGRTSLRQKIATVATQLDKLIAEKERSIREYELSSAEKTYLNALQVMLAVQERLNEHQEKMRSKGDRSRRDSSVEGSAAKRPENLNPASITGTWFFHNPEGDDEQMAIFANGRVVVLYSNGHRDETRLVDGTVELAEYDGLKTALSPLPDGSLIQRSGPAQGLAKIWERIDPEPRTEMLRPLTGKPTPPATQPADDAPQTSQPAETQSVNRPVGRVLLPDGQPAAGATVALVLPDHQVRFENGRFSRQLHARTEKPPPGPTTTTTDSAGRFTLPAGLGLHPLVVTHESGYAEALLNTGQPIRLQPWGRVEGAMFPPDHPEPNPTDATLTAARPVGSSTLQDPQEILHTYEAATDPDGNFRFDRVAPGRYWIRRKLSWMVTGDNPEIEVPAGSRQYIALYAPVRGRLVATAGSGITITPKNTRLRIVAVAPYPAWSGSAENLQEVSEHYSQFIASREFEPFTRSVAVDIDGSFVLPALPTATYTLEAEVFKHPLSKAEVFEKPLVSVVFGQPLIHAGYNQLRGVLKQTFTVPATQDRSPPPPVVLGYLPVGPAGESR
ncbi:MAG: hypothetical protein AMXMBFR13_01530 [Phycisphaerae bacterium]